MKTPITLLTGFLGSGKTTLLNHLINQPELSDTLVIINEFGEIALDHLLVEESNENVLMEMDSGCMCCTVRGDLVNTLHDVTAQMSEPDGRQLKRIIIETTGLADPAPIIHTLMTDRWIAEAYQLDGVVTTVDFATGSHTLDQHKESVKQAALADLLLLTKGDMADEADKAALISRLTQINPSARKLKVASGQADPNQLLNLGLFTTEGKLTNVEAWLKEEAYREQQDHHHDHDCHEHGCDHDHAKRHGDNIESFCLTVEKPISKEALQDWMQLLMSLVGSNILRIKGLLNIEGVEEPLVIHGVQQLFHPPVPLPAWPNDDQRTRLVFITQNVSKEFIENTFKELIDIAEP